MTILISLGLILVLLVAPVKAARITVFAAASLTDAFTEIAKVFRERYPDVELSLNFAGSQVLASQILLGARADIYASANPESMARLVNAGLVDEREVFLFARNRLALVIPSSNPGQLTRLQDLARPNLKLVMGHPGVPVGRYTLLLLDSLAGRPEFGPDFKRAVLKNVVSEEQDVKFVLFKVAMGEADAGFVYVSDLRGKPASRFISLSIPKEANPLARYLVARLKEGNSPGSLHSFIHLLLSKRAQQALSRHGFLTEGQ